MNKNSVFILIFGFLLIFAGADAATYQPWNEQDLKILNELFNKHILCGYKNPGERLPIANRDDVIGLNAVQLLITWDNVLSFTFPENEKEREDILAVRKSYEIIQNSFKKQLNAYGINVKEFETIQKDSQIIIADKNTPVLQFLVVVYHYPDTQIYAYTCRLSLFENVRLNKNHESIFAETWHSPNQVGIVTAPQNEIEQKLLPFLKNQMEGELEYFLSQFREKSQK